MLLLFQYAGAYAWLYVWAAATLFSLAVSYVAPTWIMPLFNKFTPMEPGELRDAILNYAKSVNFPLKNVFVMDGSKRSTRGNAFFTGFGRNKRIALFDTLIARHTVGEMVGVLAHEIGHHKKKHIVQGIVVGILHSGLVLFLASIFIRSQGLYDAFSMQQPSIYAGLIFFGLLYTPLEFVIGIFSQIISRHHEREADRFAAETTGRPQDMIAALKKLSADNLSNLSPHPFFVFLKYSHPPLLERVNNIERYSKS
jgi:STE24 endopeptidase